MKSIDRMQLSLFPVFEEKLIDVNMSFKPSRYFSVVSLFSGCGGKDLGVIGDFFFNNKHYDANGFNIIWSNDISKEACKTYSANFNHFVACENIKDIDVNLIPKADIVIGGFPCQDFSVAGKRKGFDSERGQLYLEMKRVIVHCEPIAFVAENVEGLTNLNGNSTIETIKKDFEKCGYNVSYKLLNAADYGVPQTRKRVFIVGIKSNLNFEFFFPQPTHGENTDKPWVTAKTAIDDLWHLVNCNKIANHSSCDISKAKFYENKKMQGNCQIDADKPSPTIRAEHHGNIEGHYRSNNSENPNDILGWRRLSVRECARLQTFPDNFVFVGSATHTYKQIGNAVPPVLSWHIFRALSLCLNNLKPQNN